MTEILRHRGPDDHGYLCADTLGGRERLTRDPSPDLASDLCLGSRRLAITDIGRAGAQPIRDAERGTVIVFNGAIHNHEELRDELAGKGHVFRTRTDTEVILKAFAHWGEACATRFNGMWAYAIWEPERRRLVLSRDRFGIKPLFVSHHGGAFHFGSEAKAILAGGAVPVEPDIGYLGHVVSSRIALEGRRTAFATIEQLPAGCNLVVTPSGLREHAYWSYEEASAGASEGKSNETFGTLLRDAVAIRTRAEVPSALLLSGGLDSSALAMLMPNDDASRPPALSARFEGSRLDESRFASIAAARAGLSLSFVDYDASELLGDLERVTWHMGMPAMAGQELARWALLGAASRRAKIVLEGQGADELLGGYPRVHTAPYVRAEIGRLRAGNALRVATRVGGACTTYLPFLVETLRTRLTRSRPPDARDLLACPVPFVPDDASEAAIPTPAHAPHPVTRELDPLSRRLIDDHARVVLPRLLHFGDAISMAHSVESRLPFLDHRLVEHALALPFDRKVRGRHAKYELRTSLARELPPEILARRRKLGFDVPLPAWLRSTWKDALRPVLTEPRTTGRGFFRPGALADVVSGFERHGRFPALVLRCAATELWFRLHVDGEGFESCRGDRHPPLSRPPAAPAA